MRKNKSPAPAFHSYMLTTARAILQQTTARAILQQTTAGAILQQQLLFLKGTVLSFSLTYLKRYPPCAQVYLLLFGFFYTVLFKCTEFFYTVLFKCTVQGSDFGC